MPHIEVRVASVKTWIKCVKKIPPSFRDGTTEGTHAAIVNRMAPGVVETELCSPSRKTAAIQSELESLETGMTSIRTISEV